MITQSYKDLQIHSALIPLSKGKFAIVDPEMYDYWIKWKWHVSTSGYAVRSAQFIDNYPRHTIRMHRLLMGLHPDDKHFVDHINRNKLDNRKCNLRLCTKGQNSMNMGFYTGKDSRGVDWDRSRKKWRAQIGYNGEHKMIGRYNTKEEAQLAYDAKAIELFGEFATLNFPRKSESA